MDKTNLLISQKINIRKNWLFSLIALYIFNFLTLFISRIITAYENQSSTHVIDIRYIYIMSLTTICALSIATWIHYYCAYKKQGTRLLLWTIIFGGLKYIENSLTTIKEIKEAINLYEFNFLSMILCIFYLSFIFVGFSYLFNSWKLYQLNSIVKKQLHSMDNNATIKKVGLFRNHKKLMKFKKTL